MIPRSLYANALLVRGIQAAAVALALIAWYVTSTAGVVPELLLPPLGKVLPYVGHILTDPKSYHHIQVTIIEFLAAMAVSLITGLTLGALAGTIRYFGELVEPVILALYAVPIIMIYPLCILFFGVGPASKIVFAGIYCLFPIAIQTMKGIRHVDRSLIRAALAMGASRWQLLWKVLIPAAFPVVLTGLRLAAVLSILAVVAGEMIASVEGIGSQISAARGNFNSVGLYAWILVVIGMVTLLSSSLALLDRRYSGDG